MGCTQSSESTANDDETPQQTDMSPLDDPYIKFPSDKPYEITWELTKKIRIEAAWDQWHRDPEMVNKYKEQKNKVLKEYDSMSSYLLKAIFEVELYKNDDGKLAPKDNVNLGKRMKFTANQYPYNFSQTIQHDLLWCTYNVPKQGIINAIKKNVPADHDVLWWVNPAKFRSVPGLYHVQIVHTVKQ